MLKVTRNVEHFTDTVECLRKTTGDDASCYRLLVLHRQIVDDNSEVFQKVLITFFAHTLILMSLLRYFFQCIYAF